MKYKHVSKVLSEAVTRLRAEGIVGWSLLPECGLLIETEMREDGLVEVVRDLEKGGIIVQEVALPQKGLIILQAKQ